MQVAQKARLAVNLRKIFSHYLFNLILFQQRSMRIFFINTQFLNPFNFVELHFDNHDKSDDGKPENSKTGVDCVNLDRLFREYGKLLIRAKKSNKLMKYLPCTLDLILFS